jgi:hypothetical protein
MKPIEAFMTTDGLIFTSQEEATTRGRSGHPAYD